MSYFKIEWFNEYNIKPKVIFDVGAGTGKDAYNFKKAFPNAVVFAFEPSLEEPIASKFIKNCSNGVYGYQLAVGAENCPIYFYQSYGQNKQSSSVYKPTQILYNKLNKMKFRDPIEVQQITIKSFCLHQSMVQNIENKIDLLHIDAHGAEKNVIIGLENIRPKLIYSEVCAFDRYNCGYTKEEFNYYLSLMGYKLEKELEFDNLYLYIGE